MISLKQVLRSKMVVKVLYIFCVAFAAAVVMLMLWLEALSPMYLFVNDTDNDVHSYIIGAGSPGVRIDIAPGGTQVVDMPSWYGTFDLPRTTDGKRVEPRWNFIVFKIYYLSSFPEKW